METLTTSFTPPIRVNDLVDFGDGYRIVDAVQGNTITISRPKLGHYIAWAILMPWRWVVETFNRRR